MSDQVIASGRCEQLRERCVQQRQQLMQQFAVIELRLQTADVIVSMVGRTIKRPELWMAGLAGLWTIKRSTVWSLMRRGWMIWSAASRMMEWFKR